MANALDRVIVALSLVGLAYFAAPDVHAWLKGRAPVEVSCPAR